MKVTQLLGRRAYRTSKPLRKYEQIESGWGYNIVTPPAPRDGKVSLPGSMWTSIEPGRDKEQSPFVYCVVLPYHARFRPPRAVQICAGLTCQHIHTYYGKSATPHVSLGRDETGLKDVIAMTQIISLAVSDLHVMPA